MIIRFFLNCGLQNKKNLSSALRSQLIKDLADAFILFKSNFSSQKMKTKVRNNYCLGICKIGKEKYTLSLANDPNPKWSVFYIENNKPSICIGHK